MTVHTTIMIQEAEQECISALSFHFQTLFDERPEWADCCCCPARKDCGNAP